MLQRYSATTAKPSATAPRQPSKRYSTTTAFLTNTTEPQHSNATALQHHTLLQGRAPRSPCSPGARRCSTACASALSREPGVLELSDARNLWESNSHHDDVMPQASRPPLLALRALGAQETPPPLPFRCRYSDTDIHRVHQIPFVQGPQSCPGCLSHLSIQAASSLWASANFPSNHVTRPRDAFRIPVPKHLGSKTPCFQAGGAALVVPCQ
jgi:hypothetical protein